MLCVCVTALGGPGKGLLAEQEGEGEEAEQRSKRPHVDSCPDATSDPLSTLHANQA